MQAMTLFKGGTGLLSIRWKMTLLYTALLALLLGAFGTFIYFSAQRLMEDNLQQSLQNHFNQALMQAHHSADEINGLRGDYNLFSPDDSMQLPPGTDQNQPGASPLTRRLAPTIERLSGPGLFVQLSDTSGKVLATSSNLGDSHLPLPAVLPSATNQTKIERVQFPAGIKLTEDLSPQDRDKSLLMVQSGLVVDDHGKVFGLLQVAQSLVSVEQVRDGLVDVLTEGLAVALVLAIVAGLWLAGRLLRPIDKITETAKRIEAGGDLSRRIPVAQGRSRKFTFDEVGRLTATFNAMLARLEKSFLAQRQFIADASHELKTPLTAILGHANLLRRHGKTDPALVDEAATAIIEEAQRLHRMTLDLLELARADEATEKTPVSQRRSDNFEVFSLTGLVNQVVKEMQPLAQDQGINLKNQNKPEEAAFDNPVQIKGDPARFRQVVVNLVDNALKFTPPGGEVTLTVKLCQPQKDPSSAISQTAQAVLEVSDTGCGIPAEALPHIFERFYRADQARSHSTLGVSSGSGLGLAIVQEVVQQHNGTLKVESQPGTGTCFEVILPAAKVNNNNF